MAFFVYLIRHKASSYQLSLIIGWRRPEMIWFRHSKTFRVPGWEMRCAMHIFACFHAFSSVLFNGGKAFRKHPEVRSAFHRDDIRLNNIDPAWGKHYDGLYDNRQKADYRPLVSFEPEQGGEIFEQSQAFVQEMKRLANQ
jgi:uncharacterized protein (UPF0332 family)